MKITHSLLAASLLTGSLIAGGAAVAAECASGKTISEGRLTIATGNPAYAPWVMDDDPASGNGFEAATAYAVAGAMGFDASQVDWVRTSFDEAIQPGEKDFDSIFNSTQSTKIAKKSSIFLHRITPRR